MAAIALAILTGCDAGSSADSTDDLKQWQGTWKMVSSSYDGAPQTADMEWVVSGDHYKVRFNGNLEEVPTVFKLDAARKRIEATHHETPPGTFGGRETGIYRISDDSLTVCYDLTGLSYPDSFATTPGSRRVLYQFRRE